MWPDCSPPSIRLPAAPRARTGRRPVVITRTPCSSSSAVQAEIRHRRDGDDVDAEMQARGSRRSGRRRRPRRLVDGEHPVAVAVERDAEVEPAVRRRSAAGRARVGRAAADVDVRAVRLVADRVHLCAELLERPRRDPGVGAVRAVDRDPQPRQVGAEPLDDVLEVAVGRRRRRGRSRRRRARSASSSASISSSGASVSFRPSRSKNFTPLYSGGLCDAVITAPTSSASSATAGVGSTPASTAAPPADATPRANASSSSRPDARVSRPTKTRAAPAQSATPCRASRPARASGSRRRSRGRRPCRSTRRRHTARGA